jgi:hypothetical protein
LTYGDDEEYVNFHVLEYGFNAKLTNEQRYFILPLILKICDLSEIQVLNKNQISKIIPRLQTMLSPNNKVNDIHVDYPNAREEGSYYVIIFYPHNIDGDTILYNETTLDFSYSKFSRMGLEEKKEVTSKFTILERITPKENRALIFRGNRYHASSSPSKGPRCIINIHIDDHKIEENFITPDLYNNA